MLTVRDFTTKEQVICKLYKPDKYEEPIFSELKNIHVKSLQVVQ